MNNEIRELELMQDNINKFVVEINKQMLDVVSLVQNMNERLSIVEARGKASQKWCQELQSKIDRFI